VKKIARQIICCVSACMVVPMEAGAIGIELFRRAFFKNFKGLWTGNLYRNGLKVFTFIGLFRSFSDSLPGMY